MLAHEAPEEIKKEDKDDTRVSGGCEEEAASFEGDGARGRVEEVR